MRGLAHLGIQATPPAGDDGMVVIKDDGPELTFEVEARAYGTGAQVAELIANERPDTDRVPMFVADKITADARDRLTDAGWSWLDRRGRLHVDAPGTRIDVDVPADPRAGVERAPADPIGGPGGLAVAYWLCDHPGRAVSPTRLAPVLGFAPSTISTAHRRLIDAGLVGDDGAGLFPELFWELAAAWEPEWVWVAAVPELQPSPADPAASRWRRAGTAAAASYGAPVVSAGDGPVELYLSGPVELNVMVRRHRVAAPGAGAAALAVAPVRAVTAAHDDGVEPPDVAGWPAAPLLAVALDLAQDRARGRQILDEWDLDGAVWR